MGKRISRYNNVLWLTLWFGFLSGCCGVLVDIDHYLTYKGITLFFQLEGRPFHVLLAIIAGCFSIYCCSRISGLVNKQILKNIVIFIGVIAVLCGLELLWVLFMSDV